MFKDLRSIIFCLAVFRFLSLQATIVDDKLSVYHTETAPQIDGEMDDVWFNAGRECMTHFTTDYGTEPGSWLDLFSAFRILYDDTGLYLFFSVYDDDLQHDADAIVLYLDGDHGQSTTYDANDLACRWTLDGSSDNAPNSPFVFRHTAHGYDFELHWVAEDLPFAIQENLSIGFEIQIDDYDGANLEHILLWHGTLNQAWQDPNLFGTAVLISEETRQVTSLLDINYISGSPTIDGVRESWWNALPNVGMNAYVDEAGETDLTLLSGRDDLRFNAWYGWNEDRFYVFVEVIDDTLNTSDADESDRDCIELFFDGDNSKNSLETGYDDNDIRGRWILSGANTNFDNSDYAFSLTDDGYQFELAIAREDLLPLFDLEMDHEIGFEVRVVDDDNGTGAWDAAAQWWSHSNETWLDASQMGEARLVRLNPGTVASLNFSPSPDTYEDETDVQITTSTSDAAIYYTLDGTEPSKASLEAVNGQVHLSASASLRAIGYHPANYPSNIRSGYYELKIAEPVFSPAAGLFTGAQLVTLQSTSPSATIHYTTDGTEPTEASPVYAAPVAISNSTTLKARGFRSGWTASEIHEGVYYIQTPTTDRPEFSPDEGRYSGEQTIALTCSTPNANIYYTVDGSTPSEQSTLYANPFSITKSTLIKAVAFFTGWHESLTALARYSIPSSVTETSFFEPVTPTGIYQLVLVQAVNIPGTQLEAGDEIGLFAGNLCVGSGLYTGGMPLTLDAWLTEDATIPGAQAGDTLIYKIRSSALPGVVPALPVYVEGRGMFGEEVTQILQLNAQVDTVSAYVIGKIAGFEGSAVDADGSASYSPFGSIVQYEWDWNGDGSYDMVSVSPETTYVFPNNGSFEARLRVTDENDGKGTFTFPVTINNVAPVMTSLSLATISEGDTFALSQIRITDPALGAETYSADVTWGDGETSQAGVDKSTAYATLNAKHMYGDDGLYQGTVILDDGDGGQASQSFSVQVKNVRPTISDPQNQVALKNVPFYLSDVYLTDPAGANDTYRGTAYWGDGDIESVQIGEYTNKASINATHTYADSGRYIVSLLVTDDDGGRDTSTFYIHVFAEDVSPPELQCLSPVAGALRVPLNAPIVLSLVDNYYGVNRQSMSVRLNDQAIVASGQSAAGEDVTITEVTLGYEIVYMPSEPLDAASDYVLSVLCADHAQSPNRLSKAITFQTGETALEEIISKRISSTGGTVGRSNDAKVIIPALALESATDIFIGRCELPLALPDTAKNVDIVYYFSPEAAAFSKSITIELPFITSALNELGVFDVSLLHVYALGASSQLWQAKAVFALDEEQQYLSFQTDRLGYYALAAWQPAMAPLKTGEWISVYNYPNPFSDQTFIEIESDETVTVSLKIFDLNGVLVKTIIEGTEIPSGVRQQFIWDGLNGLGRQVANHVYYLVIRSEDGKTKYHKMAVLK